MRLTINMVCEGPTRLAHKCYNYDYHRIVGGVHISYTKFVSIFKTARVESAPIKVISDPITVEIVKEARRIMLSPIRRSVWSTGSGGQAPLGFTPLNLDPETYHIILTARTTEENHDIARKLCEVEIDRVITSISVIYDRLVFGVPVYRGWIFEPQGKTFLEGAAVITPPIQVDDKFLARELARAKVNQTGDANNDAAQRFKLISRFFRKSLTAETPEDKLFYLWTILEVFPMKGNINIKPIGKLLAGITEKPEGLVKEKLAIGRIYGARCDLVHHGRLVGSEQEINDLMTKLERIVKETIRKLSGLPYSLSLDQYL